MAPISAIITAIEENRTRKPESWSCAPRFPAFLRLWTGTDGKEPQLHKYLRC